VLIPGLKSPVRTLVPVDDANPSEVDAFIKMIRAEPGSPDRPRMTVLVADADVVSIHSYVPRLLFKI
jgi:hypothetical protein